MRPLKWTGVLGMAAVAGLAAGQVAWAQDVETPESGMTVLGDTTYWRTHVTWRTPEVISAGGELKPLTRRTSRDPKAGSEPVPVWQSQAPPAAWTQIEFDDSRWARARAPHGVRLWNGSDVYTTGNPAEVEAIRVRGKFPVEDPASVRGLALSLHLQYAGGAVVYLNGREIARFHMPDGPIGPDTVAERYSEDSYLRPDSKLINERFDAKANKDRIASRIRNAGIVGVPAERLKKGVNVLAVEVRRAPLWEGRLTGKFGKVDWRGPPTPWAHAMLESVTLVAPAGAAVVANTARPKGLQVWTCRPNDTVTLGHYGDPGEAVRPVNIVGARNGHFSGRLVVSSTDAIKGLNVTVSDLRRSSGSGSIPATAVRVRYAAASDRKKGWNSPGRYEALLDRAPAEVPVAKVTPRGRGAATLGPAAVVPVWVTVRVPADAAAGDYGGQLTVKADGAEPVQVPVKLTVADWRVPDPKDFVSTNNFLQSFDTVAQYYKVPLWSEKHFALVGRSLELLAEVGNRFCVVELTIGHGCTNSSQSLVRWIKTSQGGYTHDFTLLDKYLDLFDKKVGKPHLVRLNVWGESHKNQKPLKVSRLDPATGTVEPMEQPPHGTPESLAFWKPVMAGVRERLEKRGWFRDTAVGYSSYCWAPSPQAVAVYKQIWPDGKWLNTSHSNPSAYKSADGGSMPVPYCEHIWGAGRLYNPDAGRIRQYPTPWKRAAKRMEWGIPRVGVGIISTLRDSSRLVAYRAVPEAALQGNLCGLGSAGADLWPLVNERGRLYDRAGSSGGVGPKTNVRALLSPGPDGAMPNERFEMFREGVQVREAIIVVQKALDANALTSEAAKQAKALLDERARYYLRTRPGQTYHWIAFESSDWQSRDHALFALAGQAAKVLDRR